MDDIHEEEWCVFDKFPRYEVSNTGRVINRYTDREIRQSLTQAGQVKVGLTDIRGERRTMLVKTLVAEAFVEGKDEIFDTVINLDGDQTNCHFTNLVWRPRWFALQWARQQTRIAEGRKPQYLRGQIVDLDTRQIYENVVDAARNTGSAHSEIFVSAWMQQRTWPDNKRYRFLIDERLGELGTPEEYTQIYYDYQNMRFIE